MDNVFLRRQFQNLRSLDSDAIDLFLRILKEERPMEKGQRWIEEGGKINKAYVITEGWAVRYKQLSDGSRQILNFQIPGDIVAYYGLMFRTSTFTVAPLTNITRQSFTPQHLYDVFRQSPQMAVALSWLAGQAERQLNEQLIRIGRRGARERMAHLFMELNYRLLRVGITQPEAELLPLTQPILADALGMSHVHTHRTFRELVRDGLILWDQGRIRLRDTAALSRLASFDARYLEQQPLPPATREAFFE